MAENAIDAPAALHGAGMEALESQRGAGTLDEAAQQARVVTHREEAVDLDVQTPG